MPLAWLAFSYFPHYSQTNWALLVLIPGWMGLCSRALWVSPTNSPGRLGVSPATITPTVLQPEVLRLSFPTLEPRVVRSILLPSCSSQCISTQTWDRLVLQLPPCCASSPTWPPFSAPPISLNECFFFNSLVVRLPYSSSLVIFSF